MPKKDINILIRHLQTTTPLAEMKEYYGGALGMPVVEEQNKQITFGAGQTHLTYTLLLHVKGIGLLM